MPRIPIFSRLALSEYFALGLAFVLLSLEWVLSAPAAFIPAPVLNVLRQRVIPAVTRQLGMSAKLPRAAGTSNPVGKMKHIKEIVEHFGFPFEEHVVNSDNYRLQIHRIPGGPRRSSTGSRSPARAANASGTDLPFTTSPLATPTKTSPTVSSSSAAAAAAAAAAAGSGSGSGNGHAAATLGITSPSLELMRSNSLRRPNSPYSSVREEGKPVVLLWHGFMMCSDVWVLTRANSLAFMLAEEGYDVWLGNNRGNKYAFKHVSLSARSDEFWDFSLDDYTRDLSHTVDYILKLTGQKSLIYIGFSQGTAQLFAALSCDPDLNAKIRLACCLAPTGKPHDLRNSFVTSLVKSSPHVLYLLFGRQAAISSVLYWQSLFSAAQWSKMLDFCMGALFSWTLEEISAADKLVLYQFLFSTASVKSVVHWFQIIRSGAFHMFDDDPSATPWSAQSLTHPPAGYPLKNIATPIALFYGGRDTLSDLPFLLGNLPPPVFVHKVADYEHLDCLWAESAREILFPAVVGALRYYGGEHPDGSMAVTPNRHPTMTADEIDRVMSFGLRPEDVVRAVAGSPGHDGAIVYGGAYGDGDDEGREYELDPLVSDLLIAVESIPGIRAKKEIKKKPLELALPAAAVAGGAGGGAGGKGKRRVKGAVEDPVLASRGHGRVSGRSGVLDGLENEEPI